MATTKKTVKEEGEWLDARDMPKPATPKDELDGLPLRPMVNGLVALNEEEKLAVQSAVVVYAPYPLTPLLAENVEERKQAALKVAKDAAHLAFVLGEIQKSHADYSEKLAKKLARETAEFNKAEEKRLADEAKAKREAELAEIKQAEDALAARKADLKVEVKVE